MDKVILGKTGIEVNKNGFGALPIQRITKAEAVYILQKAFYNGINYFDTARAYTDSEEKIGAAFSYIRDKLIISTKTAAKTGEGLKKDLEESLRMLQTDYIDIYQFHNPFLSQTWRWYRTLRSSPGGKASGKDQTYRYYQPSDSPGKRSDRVRTL